MAGKLLGDTEVREAIKDGLLEVSELDADGVNLRSADCRIQPRSLDLTVGQIFDPPKDMHGLDNLERWPQPLMRLLSLRTRARFGIFSSCAERLSVISKCAE
ncbi:hypothetical protein [Roseovarius sp. MMSF_3281]|uniref:hypothetical protein n=1 Tax=Roseovarius sp. MMSF_3281 TaxID=3046694 RepID=UPI00273EB4AD|nr:hypothetical protein [Roseovarius sp. MMSF_3281]